jgi:hypothetical protein
VKTHIAVAAVALALAGVAAAATPQTLSLRAADFPAGAKATPAPAISGPNGKSYTVTFNFKAGGREEEVTALVWVAPSAGVAKRLYAGYVQQTQGFQGERSLTLPRYGDAQAANWADYKPAGGGGAERARSALVVLKGRVFWELTVEDCNGAGLSPAGCAFGPTPPKIKEATAVAELKKYAAKQRARVGNG